ncbi:glycine-rich protein [Coccidioides immitis RS]|uniref:Glycine-rich protein n=1 Tax=Coccidioides immitis (strain RS) TaxID=246410 RepID=J3K7D6_COCIM|nr:glycine-rich protein [Coccidioides immitis RS]EAS30604.3 glycine-rich protein [Coccidioides immitis RS]
MSSAVNELADTMANTSLNEPTNGTPAATAEIGATAASADEGRRLYIGNLAYATTEGELKEFFKGYNVESVSIPVNPRTNRPVGYAFVDLATAQEAQAAIAALTGKDILERRVSVQIARKPEPAEGKAESGAEGTAGGQGRKRGGGRGRGRGRGRGGRFGRGGRANGVKAEATGEEAAPIVEVTNTAEGATEAAEAGSEGKDAAAKPQGRPRKQRGPPEDGIPSKTKVMVANLPYDLSEDKLKELFAAYEPVSAKIALRPIPRFMVKKLQARGEARKGRGFGFVTLGSEDLQKKAVEEMHGKNIDGREIAVKVAIDSPGKEDEPAVATETTEPATQEAAPATA